MEYFTEKGALQVREKYKKEIGKEFFFDDSEVKRKLIAIIPKPSVVEGGFHISFQSELYQELPILKFVQRNNLSYNFYDFDIINI